MFDPRLTEASFKRLIPENVPAYKLAGWSDMLTVSELVTFYWDATVLLGS